MPNDRLTAISDDGLVPFLFWNEITTSATGAALACPQCACANLHLDTIHFATPTDGHYTPTIGLSINPVTGAIIPGDEARQLHHSTNRGPMLSVGYWCEDGCRGRIELREHKGNLFTSLHNEPSTQHETLPTERSPATRTSTTAPF